MTVGELGRRMSAAEFMEWAWLQQFEPLPDPWMQSGIQAALTVNLQRTKGRPAKPDDFIPRRPERTDKPEQVDQSRAFAQFRSLCDGYAKRLPKDSPGLQ